MVYFIFVWRAFYLCNFLRQHKGLLIHKRLVHILNDDPVFFRYIYDLFTLERFSGMFVADDMTEVYFVFKNLYNRLIAPIVWILDIFMAHIFPEGIHNIGSWFQNPFMF